MVPTTTNEIRLSRRNLLTLLAKLERDGSSYVIKPNGICVAAESDAVHYKNHEPGVHSPETERLVQEIESLLALRHFLKGD